LVDSRALSAVFLFTEEFSPRLHERSWGLEEGAHDKVRLTSRRGVQVADRMEIFLRKQLQRLRHQEFVGSFAMLPDSDIGKSQPD
jgi:hypothetical protein